MPRNASTLPTLVLLPGIEGSGVFFDPFVRAAAQYFDCRVISYPEIPSMNGRALENFILSQLPAGDCFMLAESFSGPVAIAVARQMGKRIKGLILAATFARQPLPAALVPMVHLSLQTFGKVMPPDAVTQAIFLDKRSAYLLDQVRERMQAMDPDTFISRCNAALAADATADLAALDIPLLILSALHDRIIHKSAAIDMKKTARNAALVELDAPHFLLQSMPAETSSIIHDFIQKTGIA